MQFRCSKSDGLLCEPSLPPEIAYLTQILGLTVRHHSILCELSSTQGINMLGCQLLSLVDV